MTSAQRAALLPELPPIAESGVPGYQASIWTGMFGPAKLPKALVDLLNKQVVRIVQEPGFKAKMNQMGSDTVGSTPEQFKPVFEADVARFQRIVAYGHGSLPSDCKYPHQDRPGPWMVGIS